MFGVGVKNVILLRLLYWKDDLASLLAVEVALSMVQDPSGYLPML